MTERILLDTNIFITGYSNNHSPENQVLNYLQTQSDVILLLSSPLEDQIRRVARRVGGKDWAGFILSRIWRDFFVEYISLPVKPLSVAEKLAPNIPREDWLIFLTALQGKTTILISGNRKFLKQSAIEQNLFKCVTSLEFLAMVNDK